MELGLHHKQTTRINMTREIHQAISILHFTTLDLWAYLKEKALENPVLNIDDSFTKAFYTDSDIENYPGVRNSWREELVNQIGQANQTLEYIIFNLDERGFLPFSTEDLAADLSVSVAEVEHTVNDLKEFEQRGFGCSGIHDYLLFQLDMHDCRHLLLDDSKKENMHHLRERLKDSPPYPSHSNDTSMAPYIIPDIVVKKENGEYVVSDPHHLHTLIRVDPSLEAYSDESEDTRAYLHVCYQQADWLMRSLKRRKSTILKVADVLVTRQSEFLEGGDLRPLTQREVAESIGVHESTVSRAVANKYMQAPGGTVAMKSFFATKVKGNNETVTSASHVKRLIKHLIEDEDQPLSDQKIVASLLKTNGIQISRRTVAKYRETMGIPSSAKRRIHSYHG